MKTVSEFIKFTNFGPRSRRVKSAVAALLVVFHSSCVYALFGNTQLTSARPLALGGAFVAVADDASAVNINPAGLSQLNRSEISFSYSNLYGVPNLSENYLALATPWKFNSFGFSYQRLALSDLFKEETFTLSYGRSLRRLIAAGINLKMLRLSVGNFSASDTAAQSVTSEISMDMGFWSNPWEQFHLGLALYDLNSPRLQVLNNSKGEKIVPNFRTGFAYRPKTFILFSGDMHTENGAFTNLGDNYHLGLELLFAKVIALRMGVDRSKFGGGIGFQKSWAKIDFAFFNQGELGLLYRASVTFRWGK